MLYTERWAWNKKETEQVLFIQKVFCIIKIEIRRWPIRPTTMNRETILMLEGNWAWYQYYHDNNITLNRRSKMIAMLMSREEKLRDQIEDLWTGWFNRGWKWSNWRMRMTWSRASSRWANGLWRMIKNKNTPASVVLVLILNFIWGTLVVITIHYRKISNHMFIYDFFSNIFINLKLSILLVRYIKCTYFYRLEKVVYILFGCDGDSFLFKIQLVNIDFILILVFCLFDFVI